MPVPGNFRATYNYLVSCNPTWEINQGVTISVYAWPHQALQQKCGFKGKNIACYEAPHYLRE